METTGRGRPAERARQAHFDKTHWSVVLAAGSDDSAVARVALETLCQTYWFPLYAYIRRKGYGAFDAEDLTQGFLTVLVQRKALEKVTPFRAKFRSWLLRSMDHYLIDQYDRRRAVKRGGGQPLVSIDAQAAEKRYQFEPMDHDTPDKVYDRHWAVTVLEAARLRLSAHYQKQNKADLYQHLRSFLVEGAEPETYAVLADRLGMTEAATRKAVHRLRQRFGDAVRQEIAQTVASPAEVDQELRALREILQN